jgi:hypothetical protein
VQGKFSIEIPSDETWRLKNSDEKKVAWVYAPREKQTSATHDCTDWKGHGGHILEKDSLDVWFLVSLSLRLICSKAGSGAYILLHGVPVTTTRC